MIYKGIWYLNTKKIPLSHYLERYIDVYIRFHHFGDTVVYLRPPKISPIIRHCLIRGKICAINSFLNVQLKWRLWYQSFYNGLLVPNKEGTSIRYDTFSHLGTGEAWLIHTRICTREQYWTAASFTKIQ